jgi:8-amino-7-oxononanoate synthase
MPSLDHSLNDKLSQRKKQGLLRNLTCTRLPADFFSNDYLGLSRSEELSHRIEILHRELGVRNGATGSRLLGGNTSYTERVERELSIVFKSEASLIFNSGYAANLAVLSAVPQKGDTIIYDSLAHASLKDGARLSLATRHSFHHNDLSDLEQKLKVSKGTKFIVIESVYSMDGDTCPLAEIIQLATAYDACIILDEAHTTGVMGPLGAGYCVGQNLHEKVDIRIYTFGKGMGVHGACVAGSQTLIQYLINFARPFIYTTALSQHQVVSIHSAFAFLASHMTLQETLRNKVALYLEGAAKLPNRTPGVSAIQSVLCPGNESARQMAHALQASGFDVRPILSPTVPIGSERLRICLHTFNGDDDIRGLTETLTSLM